MGPDASGNEPACPNVWPLLMTAVPRPRDAYGFTIRRQFQLRASCVPCFTAGLLSALLGGLETVRGNFLFTLMSL